MTTKTLLVRADATVAMGTGHVMRCLALAQAWKDAAGICVFAMRNSTAAIDERVICEGFEIVHLEDATELEEDASQLVKLARERDAEWVVVDGYQFNAEYQRRIKQAGLKLLCIDDNGDYEYYYADVVLNQNPHARENVYRCREPNTKLFLGSRYAMLRPVFARWRNWTRETAAVGNKVLVTMGGSDPDNVTLRVLDALRLLRMEDLEATIVVGGSNPHFESLVRCRAELGDAVRLLKNVPDIEKWMAWADVAVAAAGSTCWEMCLLGLPAILIDLAPNQRPIAEELDSRGCAIHLGGTNDVSAERIAEKLEWLLLSPDVRRVISERAQEIVDGMGATRVVAVLQGNS